MDMYQKRKMRAENNKNNSVESFPKVSINWYITPYDKLPIRSYFVRKRG